MDFEITQEYTETARKLETKDKAHANLFNELFQKLLNNDAFLKMTADSLAEKMLEKGMIANNLVTDNTEMVLAAPMGKLLKEQLDEQNNNINFYKIVESPQTIESLVNNAEKNSHYAVIATYFPEDLPAKNAECWIDIKVESNGRKLVFVSTSQSSATYKRVWFSGWKSEWVQYITNSDLSTNLTAPNYSEAITLSDNISTYTAPSNGYIRSELIRTGTNITYWILIQVNGVRVFNINGSDTTEMGVAFIPVSKGDVITWKFEDSQYCKSIYNMFIPCK